MTVVTDDEVERPKLTVRLCADGSVETRASYAGNDELERLVRPVLALASGLNIAAASDRDVLVANWQLIETAPKDGRLVLLAWADNPGDAPEIYRWSADFGMWLNEYTDEVWHPPTHWMPLPKPPAALLPLGGG